MKFTKIPTDTFKELQLNAGILVETFTPASGEVGSIVGATSGGINFKATPSFKDFGEDIDNCPKNMKELKKLESWEALMSGNFVTVTVSSAKTLVGVGDVDSEDATKIIPRNSVNISDFKDIWWVGDYSELNGDTNGGFCAIRLINSLSTGGFQVQSTDKEKGKFAFEFTGHYSMDKQDEVPFEVYVKSGTAESELGGA